MNDFDKAFDLLIGAEGGYVNDPQDPGGETKYGISKRSYPHVDIPNLTVELAKGIYEIDFWMLAQCDRLPWPLSCFVFDAAVNQGVENARMLLQKAVGVKPDGLLGNKTWQAIQRADPVELAAMFMADRTLRYSGTRNFDRFGRGWFKRLFKLVMEVAA